MNEDQPKQDEPSDKPKRVDRQQKTDRTEGIIDIDRVFLALDVLPEPAQAFSISTPPLSEAIKSAEIVLDTNALLIPYGAGASSLNEIVEIFKKLKIEQRIFLPSQVAREFVKNRPNKISELQQGLADKISSISIIDAPAYPILKGVAPYEKILEIIQQAKTLKKDILKENSKLMAEIRSWEWSDPVNTSYKGVFTAETIIDIPLDRQKILDELLRRQKLTIPPGYKDSTKDDLGVGDFLIWKTILHIGESKKCDLIFVSGDEKADWQHRTNSGGFLPRFELVDEYRRASGGKAFYIIQLSTLLELLSAKIELVQEIKQEETRLQEANTVSVECPHCTAVVNWRLEEHIGSSTSPHCSQCGELFHLHRTKEGVVVHKPNTRGVRNIEVQEEEVICPGCYHELDAELGTAHNSTTWCRCEFCDTSFPIHRMKNGGVKVSMSSTKI
jgi:rRNA-processing protein FCF1/endogenous inhibitor of DNA gyrase (YacG/DUF329 family)